MFQTTRPTKSDPQRLVLNGRLDEDVQVEIRTITPALAAKWLKRNTINRTLKRGLVTRLAKVIQAHQWDDVNGETIVFGDHQELLDGQHRLEAVVEAGQPITSLVVFGVTAKKRGTIDTGAMRKLADFFSMHGHKNATTLGAALTVLCAWEMGTLLHHPRGGSAVYFPTYEEGLAYLGRHPDLPDSVTRARRFPSLMPPSQAACLDYLFVHKDARLHQAWQTTMESGHLTPPHESFLTLRERLIRDKTAGIKRHALEPFAYQLKAWNAERKGKHVKVFKWHESEPLPSLD